MRPLALVPARHAAAVLALLALASCGTPRPPQAAGTAPAAAEGQPRPAVLVARARSLRAEGDVEGARARLEAALAAAPADDDARLELADLLLADGREVDRAASLLLGVRARGARVHLVHARLAELRGDDASAAADYAGALSAGDDPDVRLRLALALERLGRAGEAIGELERVRTARPDDAIARGRLAALYEGAGRLQEAEAEWRALAEARPERAQGWEDLARFCERAGRPADARAARARAREQRGGDTAARELRPLLPSKR